MRILFVHQNFPGQFRHLAPELVKKGHVVTAMTMRKQSTSPWQGIHIVSYSSPRNTTPNIHPWIIDFETKVIRGEAAFRKALQLKKNGFSPDLIIAHPGWGESLFIKDVWPHARLGIYCEFFYSQEGADAGFDPEFMTKDKGDKCRVRIKNVNNLMHFEAADAGISPTWWQMSTFPERVRPKITVIHDGIDTDRLVPCPDVSMTLNNNIQITKKNQIITFVNRNLEPYRGYHIFIRALPELLKRNPQARILIIGGNGVSYGAPPPKGTTWQKFFLNEVKGKLDLSRVHFLGWIPYKTYMAVMQISTVHVYLTYPFVLSWSLLEAMSMGCPIVASNTQPLHEAIVHNHTGRLVDFFDIPDLVENVSNLLASSDERQRLGTNAREFAVKNYDLQSVCIPRQFEWVESLIDTDNCILK
jgi:glycosyltransferase involved in cell wall biosynthesis